MNNEKQGYVYILTSPNTDYIKIGGSDYPPAKRMKEINTTEPYKSLGPWGLYDFRQVLDWREFERHFHYMFRSKLVTTINGQKELFNIGPHNVSEQFSCMDENMLVGKPKIDRLFNDEPFCSYLVRLFTLSGLPYFLDDQGAWTLVLFPGTSGGRYFTLNIGAHEVAFSTLKKDNIKSLHAIVLDDAVAERETVTTWIYEHEGDLSTAPYKNALPNSVLVSFVGDFMDAIEFLELGGVRRAVIAYWFDSLLRLKDQNAVSTYARFHNYNAVAEICKRIAGGSEI